MTVTKNGKILNYMSDSPSVCAVPIYFYKHWCHLARFISTKRSRKVYMFQGIERQRGRIKEKENWQAERQSHQNLSLLLSLFPPLLYFVGFIAILTLSKLWLEMHSSRRTHGCICKIWKNKFNFFLQKKNCSVINTTKGPFMCTQWLEQADAWF